MEEEIEKREKKLNQFLKENYLLVIILVLTLSINLYYFFLTKNQTLWWDEAVYGVNAKHLAFGFSDSLYGSAGRSILEVFMWVPLLKLGFSEVFFKFLHVLFMVACVAMTYWLGNKFFDKFVGLFAAFVMSVFWVNLYVTSRLMPDNFGLFVFLIAMVFFYKGYLSENPKPKYLWFSGPLFILAVFAREITALFGPILLIFILLKEKFRIFTNKNIWIFLILGILIMLPFILFFIAEFNDPFAFFTSRIMNSAPTLEEAQGEGVPYGTTTWFNYIGLDALRWGLLILFIIGMSYFLKLVFGFDLLFKKTENQEKKNELFNRLFLFMWVVLPFLFFAFRYKIYDERYIMTSYPAIFFISGYGLKIIYERIKKHSKNLSIFTVVFFLFIIAAPSFNVGGVPLGQLERADSLIKQKISSYEQVKNAGIWIKEHSNENDIVFSQSVPQNLYYSDRLTFPYREEGDFLKNISELKPKYMTVSIFEGHPEWVYVWPQKNQNLVFPVQVYSLNQQPVLIIYQFNYTDLSFKNSNN
jgi:hypothetical protein